jgi:hypothetical protein
MKINCMEICESKASELLPEILERLDDHCLWCADCDWRIHCRTAWGKWLDSAAESEGEDE